MASKYYSLAEGYQRSRETGDRRPAQEPDSRRHFKRKKNEKSRKTACASAYKERRREGGEAKWAAGAGAG